MSGALNLNSPKLAQPWKSAVDNGFIKLQLVFKSQGYEFTCFAGKALHQYDNNFVENEEYNLTTIMTFLTNKGLIGGNKKREEKKEPPKTERSLINSDFDSDGETFKQRVLSVYHKLGKNALAARYRQFIRENNIPLDRRVTCGAFFKDLVNNPQIGDYMNVKIFIFMFTTGKHKEEIKNLDLVNKVVPKVLALGQDFREENKLESFDLYQAKNGSGSEKETKTIAEATPTV